MRCACNHNRQNCLAWLIFERAAEGLYVANATFSSRDAEQP